MSNSNKQWCEVCSFNVNPLGHEERCRPGGANVPEISEAMRCVAWIGDSCHRMDVKAAALLMKIPYPDCDKYVESHVENKSQKQYMLLLDPTLCGSAHRLGTVFESRYFGDFREEYLSTMFPTVWEDVMDMVPAVDAERILGRIWWDAAN